MKTDSLPGWRGAVDPRLVPALLLLASGLALAQADREALYDGPAGADGRAVALEPGVLGHAPGAGDVAAETLNPREPWAWRRPLPQGNDLNAVTHGDGWFLAVGPQGTLVTSPDGEHWIEHGLREPVHFTHAVVGGGRMMAAGPDQDPAAPTSRTKVAVSTNGTNWTSQIVPSAYQHGLAYGGGFHVLLGEQATFVSANGLHWESSALPGISLRSVVFAGDQFLAAGSSGTAGAILASANGRDWTRVHTEPGRPFRGIGFHAGRFVAIANGLVATSPDGNYWSTRTVASFPDLMVETMIATPGGLLARDYAGRLWRSADGAGWTRLPFEYWPVRAIAQGGGRYVAVGEHGSIASASDGSGWTPRVVGSSRNFRGVANSAGRFVAVGNEGANFSSTDGVNWIPGPVLTTNNLHKVAFGHGWFIATGNGGTLLATPDGMDWRPLASGITHDLYGITFGDGRFVAVGDQGAVVVSTNGLDWAPATAGVDRLHGVAHGAGVFVAVGRNGAVWSSSNGVQWVAAPRLLSTYLKSVAYAHGRFVVVGNGTHQGWVLVSTNGSHWQSVGVPRTVLHHGDDIAFAGGVFVAVGERGRIASTPDGVNWMAGRSPTVERLRGIAAGAGSFVVVGNNDVILQSARFLPAPRIVRPPANLQTNLGATVELSVQAEGEAPLAYQWSRNGVALAGETNDTLRITDAQRDDSGYYTVLVRNAHGEVASIPAAVAIPVPDGIAPSLVVLNDERLLRTEAEYHVFSGTAADNTQVSGVRVSRNGAPPWDAHGTDFWVFAVPLLAGTNVLTFQAVDAMGNRSPTVTRVVYRRQHAPFRLGVEGGGTVTGPQDGALLEISRAYAVTARPAANWFFLRWTGGVAADAATVRFTMRSNFSLTAHFITNRFQEARGRYEGLFAPVDSSPSPNTAGKVTLAIGPGGGASGRLRLAGRTYPFSGRIHPDGSGRFKVRGLVFGPETGPTNEITFVLNFNSHSLTGLVARRWPLSATRADASGAFAGRYTALLPGGEASTSATYPAGDGFATLVVRNGAVTAAGRLPDGTPWATASFLGEDVRWPLLYGTRLDFFHGWVRFQADTPEVRGDDLLWYRNANFYGLFYPLGFADYDAQLVGARYARPAVAWDQGVVHLELSPFEPWVAIPVRRDGATIVPSDGGSRFRVELNPGNGTFRGAFGDPVTRRSTPLHGAFLQVGATNGYGVFRLVDRAGRLELRP